MDKRELDLIKKLVDDAKKAGADQVDAFYNWGREVEITALDGAVENLKQAVSKGVGLRIFKDHRLGFGFTSDLSPASLKQLGDQARAIALATAADENNGLPAKELLTPVVKHPDIFDPQIEALTNDDLLKTALTVEKIARTTHPKVKKVSEVGSGSFVSRVALVNSEGFVGHYEKTYTWIYADVVGEEGEEKQSAWWMDYSTHLRELENPEAIARTAVQRAVRMLGARKIDSAELPVIFEPGMTKGFIRGIFGAINGDMIYKKSSFLLDKLDEQIASEKITILDDGTLDRRTSSQPFDGEGLTTAPRAIVENGVLKRYLYDTYTANKAGAQPTGTAARDYASLPTIGSTNVYLKPGSVPPAELFKGLQKGLLITDMMGQGVNTVNGEYSRGASGLFIEHGEIAYPVQEITVAGNMLDMLRSVDLLGNDMDWRGATGAPSIRFSRLTVSGK